MLANFFAVKTDLSCFDLRVETVDTSEELYRKLKLTLSRHYASVSLSRRLLVAFSRRSDDVLRPDGVSAPRLFPTHPLLSRLEIEMHFEQGLENSFNEHDREGKKYLVGRYCGDRCYVFVDEDLDHFRPTKNLRNRIPPTQRQARGSRGYFLSGSASASLSPSSPGFLAHEIPHRPTNSGLSRGVATVRVYDWRKSVDPPSQTHFDLFGFRNREPFDEASSRTQRQHAALSFRRHLDSLTGREATPFSLDEEDEMVDEGSTPIVDDSGKLSSFVGSKRDFCGAVRTLAMTNEGILPTPTRAPHFPVPWNGPRFVLPPVIGRKRRAPSTSARRRVKRRRLLSPEPERSDRDFSLLLVPCSVECRHTRVFSKLRRRRIRFDAQREERDFDEIVGPRSSCLNCQERYIKESAIEDVPIPLIRVKYHDENEMIDVPASLADNWSKYGFLPIYGDVLVSEEGPAWPCILYRPTPAHRRIFADFSAVFGLHQFGKVVLVDEADSASQLAETVSNVMNIGKSFLVLLCSGRDEGVRERIGFDEWIEVELAVRKNSRDHRRISMVRFDSVSGLSARLMSRLCLGSFVSCNRRLPFLLVHQQGGLLFDFVAFVDCGNGDVLFSRAVSSGRIFEAGNYASREGLFRVLSAPPPPHHRRVVLKFGQAFLERELTVWSERGILLELYPSRLKFLSVSSPYGVTDLPGWIIRKKRISFLIDHRRNEVMDAVFRRNPEKQVRTEILRQLMCFSSLAFADNGGHALFGRLVQFLEHQLAIMRSGTPEKMIS